MYWKIARWFAKLINILFLSLVLLKVTFIYEHVFSNDKFYLMEKVNDRESVFYYDDNNIPYFLNNKTEECSIFDIFDRDQSEREKEIYESYLFRKIISHRLSLLYLFSIYFGDLVKVVNNMGVI